MQKTCTCPYCGKHYSKYGIKCHIWRTHGEGQNFNPNSGYQTGQRIAWNKGLTKQTDQRVKKTGESYHNRILNGSIIPPQLGKPLSDQHKKKVSEGMKKAHKEGRAWNIGMSRWNSEMSYPQKFFTLVIANQFEDKDYIHQLPVGKYSLDFAWLQKKKCIQIDGQQHLKPDAVIHDKERDEYLRQQGWKILRISWKDMCSSFKQYIGIAKQFIDLV